MNLALLAPLGLVALAALALPLLIHLVRRLQLVDTEFAALRWISPRAQPRRRLRFERPWLLLIRLLLLALLALLLARLAWFAPVDDAGTGWIVVAPGADLAQARKRAGDGEWHWLAPGFPRIDAATPGASPATSSLLRELDARLPAGSTLRVVVPEALGGLDGERAHLAHALDWIVVSGSSPPSPEASRAPVVLHVRYAGDEANALAYLRAAVAAWNVREPGRYSLDAQPASAAWPDDARWLVWLAPDPPASLAKWIEQGGVALVAHHSMSDVAHDRGDGAVPLWRDAAGGVLASTQSFGAGRLIALPRALAPADLPLLLDAAFPDRLFAALRGAAPAPTRALAAAAAPDRGDASVAATTSLARNDAVALDAWLALAIAILFALERIIATSRPREAEA